MTKPKKKIIIIGGGMAGLCAGIYALDNGFDVTIYEKNPEAGGMCTGWYRNGRYIDGCIHWLTGTRKGTELYKMWTHLGAFQDENDLINLDSFFTAEYHGTKVHFYRDLEKTRQEMISISPEDKKMINLFVKDVKSIMKMDLPLDSPTEFLSLIRFLQLGLNFLPIVPSLLGSIYETREKFARYFKHPALKYAFTQCQQGQNNFFCFLYSYSNFVTGNCALPKGGSLKMAQNMAKKFSSLGGKLILNKPVKEILVRNKKTFGVKFEDDTMAFSDYTIAACDSIYTLKNLLNDKFYDSLFSRRLRKEKQNPTPSCVQVSLEIEGDVSLINTPTEFPVEPFRVGVSTINNLNVRNYNYEPNLYVKDNKTLVTVLIDQYKSDYSFWKNLKNQGDDVYTFVKQKISLDVIKRIENQYPNLKGKIKCLDVFTPLTLERYVNATYGSYMCFSYTNKNTLVFHNQKVKGAKNLYLASQWTQSPGGLPLAIASGKFAVQKILYKEFKFTTLFKRLFLFLNNKFRKKIIINDETK